MRRTCVVLGAGVLSAVLGAGVLGAVRAQQAKLASPIAAVPLAHVKVTGGLWQQRIDVNRTVTIPHIMAQNESTGRVDNFRKGARLMAGAYQGRRFNDTDIYKIVEAASYSLAETPDSALSAKLDELIDLIAKNQEPDGYLFPARTINPAQPAPGVGAERWMHENTGSHETYNSGHLIEAAVAHYRATGKRTLLDVAIKNADLLRQTFGPNGRVDAPGHEVVEMALVRLYNVTDNRNYLDLAKFFTDTRGTNHNASLDYTEASWRLYNDRPYRQDDKPVTEQMRGEGHAVRAVYLYNAMADIAALLKDPAYDRAVDRLWADVYSKRAYVTGGLGSVGGTEAFDDDYVLPNRTAYTETCASVGAVLWNHRMFLKSGEARYLDAFEQTLYNGLLSGVSIKGDTFFYQNPLEATGAGRGGGQRSVYFDVACCPANLSRLIAQLPALVYANRDDDLFVNLYMDSTADVKLPSSAVKIAQATQYPWDGRVELTVTPATAATFTLKFRRPGWLDAGPFGTDLYTFGGAVKDQVRIALNGRAETVAASGGWYAITRRWAPGDRVQIALPMPVRTVAAHPGLKDAAGKLALQRGPVVYAFEGIDNDGKVLGVSMPATTTFTPSFRADLLGGVTTLTGTIAASADTPAKTLTAIPYYAWANRGRGEMLVWMPTK